MIMHTRNLEYPALSQLFYMRAIAIDTTLYGSVAAGYESQCAHGPRLDALGAERFPRRTVTFQVLAGGSGRRSI